MNEEWKEMMAYAPLIEEETDTDYQKTEDFTELDRKITNEDNGPMTFETEDYFGMDDQGDMDGQDEQEALVENVEDEDFMDCEAKYDDYQSMPEIPTDIYSGEEY